MPAKSKTRKGTGISSKDLSEKKKDKKVKSAEKKAAKLQAAEDRRNFLKMEKLKQEVARGTMNTKRFSQTWRDMVMNIKLPNIREDLEVAWHTFDRALDIKNYSISLLLDELDSSEEQYQVNERAHLEMINRLLDTYKIRLRSEEKNYETELQDMVDETMAETRKIISKETDDEVFLRAMMFAMEQRLEDLMKSVKGVTISKVEEFEDDNRNLRRVTKFILEKKFHILWEEYIANLTKYQTDSGELEKEYNVVKEKDDKARSIITRQLTHTANLFESIRKLKDKIGFYKITGAKEIAEIIAERDFFNEAYWTVKTRFMSEQNIDKEQLKIVTSEYNATTKHLKRILAKGENLLSLVQICRKYETLEEKVLPFKPQIGLDDYSENPAIDFGWERSHAVMEEFKNLELFWRRVGSAQLIAKQLRLERDKLREESRCLKECLQHCLRERSLPAEPRTLENFDSQKKPVIIEASLYKF